jgi:hypothetical protein
LTKGQVGDDKWFLPSVVAASNLDNVFVQKSNGYEKVRYKGKTYFTGVTAMSNTVTKDRYTTTSGSWHLNTGNLILHFSAIAKALPKGIKGDVRLVTGLPMSKYLEPTTLESFTNKLIGKHEFSCGDNDYHIEIKKENLLVLPQALGLYFNMLNTFPKRLDWENSVVGYCDVGTFSTGYCLLRHGALSATGSSSVSTGMFHIAKKLAPILKSKYNFEASDTTELLKYLKEGKLQTFNPVSGRIEIDLFAEVKPYLQDIFKDVLEWIANNWKATSMYLFVSGGGASYLYPVLKEVYPHVELIHVPKAKTKNKTVKCHKEEAIFDVVSGYGAYSESKWVEENV